ncbi:Sec-independent protein translocase protein TatB [Candidatus Electronema sp. JM]|uniref:Sec-independent protein translocase protein TatB n=1 Tax=Candidatus Electronema sp. JM TaxID=3401571 RepID=UPI003AA9328B
MFGIGFPEMLVILVVALLVVGPDKLPDLARSLAKGVNELRGAMNQIKESLNEETKAITSVKDDLRQTAVQMKDRLLADDELGGTPRRPPVVQNADNIELDADMQEMAERLEEREAGDAAAVHEEAGEERVVGKNPPPPEPAPPSATA